MKRAFTLIELLIVVAIIAILAAIAVPNFLEAQVRAKVSRAKNDMRALATGLESYYVDNNAYPKCNRNNMSTRMATDPAPTTEDLRRKFEVLEKLSTPIAYVTSGVLPDPFKAQRRSGTINPSTGASTPAEFNAQELPLEGSFKYLATTPPPNANVLAFTDNDQARAKQFWALWSAGPTSVKPQVAGTGLLSSAATPEAVNAWIYDPTNGTVSRGGIFRTGGMGVGDPNPGAVFFRETSKAFK